MDAIDLIYFNAGDGHRMTALAIEAVARELRMPWDIRLVNLADVLDPSGAFRTATGFGLEDFYNGRLARGLSFGLTQELRLLQSLIRLGHRPIMQRLRRYWFRSDSDMVVSLVPNFNRVLYESLATARPGLPYVTLLTDMADYPPHYWIEKGQAQHLICGTSAAVEQARASGYPEARIHATSGMVIRPAFYGLAELDRSAARRKLGLHPDRLTGMVMFGGHGASVMAEIASRLGETQLIVACGHNAALAQKLRALPSVAPRLVLGFTADVQHYMRVSDFFIGKPGPGALSEAVQLQLPVIVARNAGTRPQERYNAQWVIENNIGLVLPSFRAVRAAVLELDARLQEFRASVRRIDNRAVFEVPGILEQLLRAGRRRALDQMVKPADVAARLH